MAGSLLVPPSVGAAQTFGSSLADLPNTTTGGGSLTWGLASLPPSSTAAGGLTSPIDGVIVRWRIRVGDTHTTAVALRVTRPGNSDTRTGAGTSATVTPALDATSEFATRLPVQQGDGLGLDIPAGQIRASHGPVLNARIIFWSPPLQDGEAPRANTNDILDELLINADVEPDADDDGFGDETQDGCPDNPVTQQPPCDTSPPETSITKQPKDKTRKKSATFEFTSSEPGSTFECSLDGAAFAPCSSPHALRVKRGKHFFAVRAKDAAGNTDGSPATASWKVKKKRKK